MNKIPGENWQSYMLRALTEESTVILVPAWLATAAKAIGRIFGGLFILAFFTSIPFVAWEIACALLGL